MQDLRNLDVKIDDWDKNENWFGEKFSEALFISDIIFPITKTELQYLLNEARS